jgi:4-hydroxy-tetrahydrodipicolinate synthase
MSPDTTIRLAREVPNIIAVKEASGDIRQVEDIIAGAPEGFSVISGDDAMTLPIISKGGQGVISVAAGAFPEKFSRMTRIALTEGVAKAYGLWEDLQEATSLLFVEGNPVGVKGALNVKGLCRADVRLPLVECSAALAERLRKTIAEHAL